MKSLIAVLAVLVCVLAAWPLLASAQDAAPAAPAWEYKAVFLLDMAGIGRSVDMNRLLSPENRAVRELAVGTKLNELGAEGWEFVQVADDYFYFKRRR